MTLIQQGDNLPPAAYDTLNMGNIVSLFKTLQNRTDPAVQVDAWKAKLLGCRGRKRNSRKNAGLDSRTTITYCSSTITYFPREGYARRQNKDAQRQSAKNKTRRV